MLPIDFTSLTQTQQSANTIAMHPPTIKKEFSFRLSNHFSEYPYQDCLAP